MAIKKSELYSSLWKSCDALRGGMDASQYKDYILVLLFMKYVSDKAKSDPDYVIDVPEGGSFRDMVALKGDKEIGDKINKIVGKFAEANDLKGTIDVADFNDSDKFGGDKKLPETVSSLVGIFQDSGLDFSKNRAEDDDILGDAYEYLMRNFATESGKSKGQFYTPSEVSRVIAKVIGIGNAVSAITTLYDPTCGSGSLLIRAASEAPVPVSIYGQEMDVTTTALARMNMILHGCTEAEIAPGGHSTLSDPHTWDRADGRLKAFDYVVANPPFSYKSWSAGIAPAKDVYERFNGFGIPPEKNGDYAFLLHIVRSLKSTGKGACILPHGVLFRGNAEATIRKELIKRGYIKGIIGLPPNLFYGTGIPACIIIIDKEGAIGRKGIFLIDASKGFAKDGPKNRLRHQDIHRIVDVFTRQAGVRGYSHMASVDEIESNGFNLNILRYVDNGDAEDLQDMEAHLLGGIPGRDIDSHRAFWSVCPSLKPALFRPSHRPGYFELNVPAQGIRQAISVNAEFKAFHESAMARVTAWKKSNAPELEALGENCHPKRVIETISEDILEAYAGLPLIDKYDIYQILMTYWHEREMQDDVYLIDQEGWVGANTIRRIERSKDGKWPEEADITVGDRRFKADLIPPALIVSRYFASEKAAIDELESELSVVQQKIEEIATEYADARQQEGDEGEADGDIKRNKAFVIAAIKEAKKDNDREELALLESWRILLVEETEKKRKLSHAQDVLNETTLAHYKKLTEGEIKQIVVYDKWMANIEEAVEAEVDRVSQTICSRLKSLAERYETPLPQLEARAEELGAKVEAHLARMGFTWK